jgi:hypothetical protein
VQPTAWPPLARLQPAYHFLLEVPFIEPPNLCHRERGPIAESTILNGTQEASIPNDYTTGRAGARNVNQDGIVNVRQPWTR